MWAPQLCQHSRLSERNQEAASCDTALLLLSTQPDGGQREREREQGAANLCVRESAW